MSNASFQDDLLDPEQAKKVQQAFEEASSATEEEAE